MKKTIAIIALMSMTACGGASTSSNFEMLTAVSDDPVFASIPTMDDAIFSGLNQFGDPTFVSANPVFVTNDEPLISTTGVLFAEDE